MVISPKVIQLIDHKLAPLIEDGCRIDQIKMVCAAGTELVQQGSVETGFGKLRVEPSNFVPQGKSYLIEDRYRGFTWVRNSKDKERKHSDNGSDIRENPQPTTERSL
ncbi:hypothetical protein [Paenibacillus xylanexedens]|uniref:Uncharacterized protein n=1 Tax=Paenibacillus xylanexedens TaxID=528191 RepID=A0ABS4S2R4_PAEXY|nr:hypothetical protein [Paenibacillus xylanexedens]MBP2249319.1 hypothetical protein [Paenibacillus xylanexedens]